MSEQTTRKTHSGGDAGEKIFNTRIVHKHDTAENWAKAVNFVPKAGELIIYDADANNVYPRVKIGDGAKTVGELPFVDEQKANKSEVPQIQIVTWGADD